MTAELIVPALIALILLLGLIKRVDIVGSFTEGAREGLAEAVRLCPTLILLVTAVTMFTASGASERFAELASGVTDLLGIPRECTALMLIRPISGSGSIAVLDGILSECPPDSFAARTAAVMMSSAETTVYMMTVCFSSVGKKPKAGFFAAAFAADLACFLFAPIFVRSL